MSFLKDFVYTILSIQEKFLTLRLDKTLRVKNMSKRKKIYGNGYLLSLETIAESEKQKMEEELALILKMSDFEPEKVLDYIKRKNTDIFYIDDVKLLNSVGENEGFFYPQTGPKAIYLSLLVKKGLSFKTPEMFILTKGQINRYYFIYHFYNWYAYKHGIAGIDADAQELLNKYLYNSSQEEFNKLQLADIYKLKDAIKQDKAAIEFVFKLCRNYDGTKKALTKIKDNGSANL